MIKYFIEYNHALYGVFDSAEEACNFALSKFEFPEWGLNDMRFLPMRFIPPPAVDIYHRPWSAKARHLLR